jgi:beta-glucosidase
MAQQSDSTARSTGVGACKSGEYLCPSDQKTCVRGAAAYTACPGLKGTHLDHTLSEERRLAYLVQHTTLEEQTSQVCHYMNQPLVELYGCCTRVWWF